MTTDELIAQAIHSIKTNQPRMENLYMKNALEQTDKRRRELNPLAWQIRQMGKSFAMIGASLSGIFKSFELGIARAIGLEETQRQNRLRTSRAEQMTLPPVLDPASGSRMFYFDPKDERVLFGDIRSEEHVLCDGRALNINPDAYTDFRDLPFPDESFRVVVFDPPHLVNAGPNSWLAAKYGRLTKETWRDDLRAAFAECFRVLQPSGVLIFKWNETQIKVREILALTDQKPLVGHMSGKAMNTHWITFMKDAK